MVDTSRHFGKQWTYGYLILLTTLLVSCQTGPWKTRTHIGNPLVGKIYDLRKKRFVNYEQLKTTLQSAKYVLLGEKHDNADHHRLQAKVITDIATQNTAIVMEQLQPWQVSQLKLPMKLNEIEEKTKWALSGWPPFEMYSPIFEVASPKKLKLLAGSFKGTKAPDIRKGKYSALFSQSEVRRFQLNRPPLAMVSTQTSDIQAAHCGYLPAKAAKRMANVQRARDAFMAKTLAATSRAILIAGNGHTRTDWGVPHYLKRIRKDKIVSVSFQEVSATKETVDQYVRALPSSDFIWFTPAVDSLDPCEKFKRQLEYFKKRVILIDPGHSPQNPGTRGVSGINEVMYNDRFAKELTEALNKQGKTVRLTRKPPQNLSLEDRSKLIRSSSADLMLSIHHDSAQPKYLEQKAHGGWVTKSKIAGFSLFVSAKGKAYKESVRLATSLGKQLKAIGRKPSLHHAEKIPGENRPLLNKRLGIYRYDGLAVLKNSKVPAVLVELGVIVDRSDEAYVSDARNRKRMINALAKGISKFFSNSH